MSGIHFLCTYDGVYFSKSAIRGGILVPMFRGFMHEAHAFDSWEEAHAARNNSVLKPSSLKIVSYETDIFYIADRHGILVRKGAKAWCVSFDKGSWFIKHNSGSKQYKLIHESERYSTSSSGKLEDPSSVWQVNREEGEATYSDTVEPVFGLRPSVTHHLSGEFEIRILHFDPATGIIEPVYIQRHCYDLSEARKIAMQKSKEIAASMKAYSERP